LPWKRVYFMKIILRKENLGERGLAISFQTASSRH
jgi:hypothetical protein